MSSLYISEELKKRLLRAARRRGYRVERGPNSELQEYLNYLVTLDEKSPTTQPSSTWREATGLLLVDQELTDGEVDELLERRRLEL
jgi:hypothetical protein